MNEAFLRYEKGNDTFDISFRYMDEATNVDRQFNFSRQAVESVNNFLKRVDTNVCKIVNKKVRETNFPFFYSFLLLLFLRFPTIIIILFYNIKYAATKKKDFSKKKNNLQI